jgi:hypothetical protein
MITIQYSPSTRLGTEDMVHDECALWNGMTYILQFPMEAVGTDGVEIQRVGFYIIFEPYPFIQEEIASMGVFDHDGSYPTFASSSTVSGNNDTHVYCMCGVSSWRYYPIVWRRIIWYHKVPRTIDHPGLLLHISGTQCGWLSTDCL